VALTALSTARSVLVKPMWSRLIPPSFAISSRTFAIFPCTVVIASPPRRIALTTSVMVMPYFSSPFQSSGETSVTNCMATIAFVASVALPVISSKVLA